MQMTRQVGGIAFYAIITIMFVRFARSEIHDGVSLNYKYTPKCKMDYRVQSTTASLYSPPLDVKSAFDILSGIKTETIDDISLLITEIQSESVYIELNRCNVSVNISNYKGDLIRSGRDPEEKYYFNLSKDYRYLKSTKGIPLHIFFPLPIGEKVNIGDTWSNNISISTKEALSIDTYHFKLESIEAKNGSSCAIISYTLSSESTKPFVFHCQGAGNIHFDIGKGIMIAHSYEGSGSGEATIDGKKHELLNRYKEKVELIDIASEDNRDQRGK